jgi:PHD-finger
MAPSVPPPTLRKYLCLAPRPEEWEERAQAILRSNVTKDQIQKTLAKLYKMHPNLLLLFSGGASNSGINRASHSNTHSATKTPQPPALPLRTGPGRKSNAEYAIQFYEYLLPLFKDQDTKEAMQEDVHVFNDDETHQDGSISMNAPDESEKNLDGSSGGEESDEDITPTSVEQRKDVCAVCADEPGTSPLSCSKCSLIFHLSCVRPKLQELPSMSSGEQGWLCSYCVLAQTKRNTKQRKQAAAAVRYMARLRKFHQRNSALPGNERGDIVSNNVCRNDDDLVDAGDQKAEGTENIEMDVHSTVAESTELIVGTSEDPMDPKSSEAPQVAIPGATANVDTSDKKEIDSSHCKKRSTSDVETSPQRSSKRCRKQPTLYDPQVVAASRWQTDELTAWKLARAEASGADSDDTGDPRDDEDDGSYNKTDKAHLGLSTSARKLLRDKSDGIWCSFCQDDPDVPLCVFCACRVCFGKHEQTQLLLCDLCDEEYHTFCLDPPMKAVPDMKRWYCPICAKAKSRKQENSNTRSSRRTSTVDVKSRELNVKSTADATDAGSGQRRSLRSPKPSLSMMMMTTSIKNDAIKSEKKSSEGKSKQIKRPRGRPPKNECAALYSTTKSPTRSASNLSISDHTSSGSSSSSSGPNPVSWSASKRKPGRPPSKPRRATSEPPRKRGRPPSESTLTKRAKIEAPSQKPVRLESKGFSSPKSNSITLSSSVAPSNSNDASSLPVSSGVPPTMDPPQEVVSLPVTVSRSGRTVRRSNFHDEVAEGAQHLKSVRSSNNMTSDPSPRCASCTPEVAPLELSNSPDKTASIICTGVFAASGTTPVTEVKVGIKDGAEGPFPDATADNHVAYKSETLSLQPTQSQPFSLPKSSLPASVVNDHMDLATTPDPASMPSVAVSTVAAASSSCSAEETRTQPAQAKEDALKQPRRKPGARECMQISRRFGVKEIPQQYMDTLLDYCNRGKVEHLIRMRERLDEHSRFLEMQLAGLESLVLEHGASDVVVPLAPPSPDRRHE